MLFAILISGCATTQPDRPGYVKATFSSKYTWKPGLPHPNFPHVYSANQQDRWNADSGYTFVSNDSLVVQWTSGQRHRDFPHIYSGLKEGLWLSDDGYKWLNEKEGDLRVKWTPNVNHSKYNNIYSAKQEGYWNPAPGYYFPKKGDLKAEWQPGQRHFYASKVYAAARERYWIASPGYRFIATKDSVAKYGDVRLRVEWVENMKHPSCKIKSARTPEEWNAIDGYRFVKNGQNLSVVKEPPNRLWDIFTKIGFALWGADASLPSPQDGVLASFGKSVLRNMSNKATGSAIDDIKTSIDESNAPGEVIPCDYWAFLIK